MTNETKHTPEPWIGKTAQVVAVGRRGSGGRVIATMTPVDLEKFHLGDGIGFERMRATQYANLRRIVACVNACAGISNESLETPLEPQSGMVMRFHLVDVQNQRDELAEALRKIETIEESSDDADFESLCVQVQTIARTALAKVQP